ncbi:TonB-dependent siderophore receptor [Pseudomonas sp. LRF_L74]|uniref:TonB-dependent siderophore receptor n=1 Tax=Pseudomonas sp. LRF_L74 TaxID=3369422 RepID=UPI003F5E6EE8
MPAAPKAQRHTPALALLLGCLGSTLASAAPTQPSTSSVQQVQFDIPAGRLDQVLNQFAAQTGILLAVDGNLTRNRTSAGLMGNYDVRTGLETILAGTGLTTEQTAPSQFRLRSGEGQATTLSDLYIDDTRIAETALGPVDGYIAQRSASATKTDTSLLRTPQSVTVVSAQQAQAQGAQSLAQSLRYAAGLSPEVRGSATRYDIPYIRGFGSPSDPIIFQDGLRLLRGPGYAIPQVEAWGSERIELLRGPSSTLYGTSMPGGLINAVSKRPTDYTRGEAELQLGSNDHYQAALDLSGPANEEGTVLYRLVTLGKVADTQVVNTEEERYYVAPSLTLKPNERTSLTLLTSYQKDPEGGYYGILPTTGSLWKSSAGQISRDFNDGDPAFSEFDREQYALGYEFEYDVDDTWTLRHHLRYLRVDSITKDVASGSLAADGHTINRYALATDESVAGLASDLQLQARVDTGMLQHTLLAGWDHQDIDSKQNRLYGAAPSIDYLNPQYGIATSLNLGPFVDQDQTVEQNALYVQDQIQLDDWVLLLGGRYDHVRTETDNNLTAVSQNQRDSAFSGKLGLLYSLTDNLTAYGSYSTSFLPVSGTDYLGNALTPTTSKQYEAGLKFQPSSFDGLFTLTYFDITQQDVVATVNTLTRYQTGEVRSQGIEFEGKASLDNRTQLIGALSYTDARVTKSVGVDKGDAPIGIPDHTASLWLDHRLGYAALKGLTLGAGVRYIGESVGGYSPSAFTAGAQRLDVPSYTLFDAMAKYDFGALDGRFAGASVQLNANNLTDKTYITCLGNNFCNYGNGRTVYASLNYQW